MFKVIKMTGKNNIKSILRNRSGCEGSGKKEVRKGTKPGNAISRTAVFHPTGREDQGDGVSEGNHFSVRNGTKKMTTKSAVRKKIVLRQEQEKWYQKGSLSGELWSRWKELMSEGHR